MKASPRKLLPLTAFVIAVTSLFSVRPAQAYTLTVSQVGTNVVATGTGALDLTGFRQGTGTSPSSQMHPSSNPSIYTGTSGALIAGYLTTSFTGPANFGSGALTLATIGSGDFVGFTQATFGPFLHFLAFDVPVGYVFNDPLSSSATWNNSNYTTLGVTPGTYVWSWGDGGANQNFTLKINQPFSVPDSGTTVCLFGCALLGLVGLRRRLGC